MVDLPDITRLRAALDVALTTLDTCSRPNSPAPAESSRSKPLPKHAPANPEVSAAEQAADPPAAAPSLAKSTGNRLNQERSAAAPSQNQELLRQQARIKELEDHVFRKGVEEANQAKRTMDLEQELHESQGRVQEYEEKLEQVLPLLQTLDQSRTEAREARRRAQITADELSALTNDHQILADELAKSRNECAAACESAERTAQELAATQVELQTLQEENGHVHKQLQDEREESAWLQQVAARQAKEMEESLAALRSTAEQHKSEYEDGKLIQQTMQEQIEQLQACLKQQEDAANIQQQKVAGVLSRMQAGNEGLTEEVLELQKQLMAMKESKGVSAREITV